jgi:hypothetical protein
MVGRGGLAAPRLALRPEVIMAGEWERAFLPNTASSHHSPRHSADKWADRGRLRPDTVASVGRGGP